ncbi:MAG: hypothetical protein IJH37_01560 [Clostridia bacterium]|nr:hypothetical protein [Clostridia bacterium]
MKKTLLSVLCAVCILTVNFPTLCGAAVSESDSLLNFDYITSDKSGNIFHDTDEITFTQNIENTVAKKVVSNYSWIITDEEGNSVASYTWSETISSKAKRTRTIKIDNPGKYGIYTINVSEENYALSSPNDKYTDTYSEEFSVCIALDENNIDDSFGYNQTMINYTRPRYCDPSVAVPLMLGSGARWHREDILWQGVEPKEKGKYIGVSSYISKINDLKSRDIKTVCILTGRNPLYDDGNCPSSDEAIAAYANFCAYVAKELHGLVDHFEIWNEWNHKNFNPTQEPAETYAKVLKAAYIAIKGVDPDIKVIGCDTAGINLKSIFWIGTVLYSLGGKYLDAISVHCYDYNSTDAFPEADFIWQAQYLKKTMDLYHVDVPIWLTEIGFSTYDNSTAGFVPGCSRDVQLNSMVMMRAVSKAYGLFDNIIQYCLYDYADQSQVESNWGVLNCSKRGYTDKPEAELLPNGAKPAYLGTAAMNYFVGGNSKFKDVTGDEDERSYAFEFYNQNLHKNVTLAINGGFDNTVTKDFELGSSSVDVYDKYGNFVRTMTSETGDYEIETYSEPIYLVYSASKLTVTKDGETITAMTELASGDRAEVKFTGYEVAEEHKPSLMIGQYKDGVLVDFEIIDADPSESDSEIRGDLIVADGVDQVRIMCWYTDTLLPVVPAYVID